MTNNTETLEKQIEAMKSTIRDLVDKVASLEKVRDELTSIINKQELKIGRYFKELRDLECSSREHSGPSW
jgi:chromosome segregation ATPase